MIQGIGRCVGPGGGLREARRRPLVASMGFFWQWVSQLLNRITGFAYEQQKIWSQLQLGKKVIGDVLGRLQRVKIASGWAQDSVRYAGSTRARRRRIITLPGLKPFKS